MNKNKKKIKAQLEKLLKVAKECKNLPKPTNIEEQMLLDKILFELDDLSKYIDNIRKQ